MRSFQLPIFLVLHVMGIRSLLAKPFASYIASQTRSGLWNLSGLSKTFFQNLIQQGRSTIFGRDHNFDTIRNYEDFKKQVPIRDYEALKPYIQQVLDGKSDVLWKGKPEYLAKTSGTTSGTKYIPITKDSIPNHIHGARNALLSYIHETGKLLF